MLLSSAWVLPIQPKFLSFAILNNEANKLNLSGRNNLKIRMCGEAPG